MTQVPSSVKGSIGLIYSKPLFDEPLKGYRLDVGRYWIGNGFHSVGFGEYSFSNKENKNIKAKAIHFPLTVIIYAAGESAYALGVDFSYYYSIESIRKNNDLADNNKITSKVSNNLIGGIVFQYLSSSGIVFQYLINSFRYRDEASLTNRDNVENMSFLGLGYFF